MNSSNVRNSDSTVEELVVLAPGAPVRSDVAVLVVGEESQHSETKEATATAAAAAAVVH